MIQRVQSLYFVVCMALLGGILSGTDIYRFVGELNYYSFNAYGLSGFSIASQESIGQESGFYYLWAVALILFTFYTLMSYKDLKKQLKLARINSFLYLITVLGLVLFGALGGDYFFDGNSNRELGPGFSLLVIAFPFSYLAQLGIKRDKKLLDSLHRLR